MAGKFRCLLGGSVMAAALVAIGLLAAHVSAQAQNSARAQNMPTPRTADGHPDLTGVWNMIAVCPPQCPANIGGGGGPRSEERRVGKECRL